jgi:hypothetical protein
MKFEPTNFKPLLGVRIVAVAMGKVVHISTRKSVPSSTAGVFQISSREIHCVTALLSVGSPLRIRLNDGNEDHPCHVAEASQAVSTLNPNAIKKPASIKSARNMGGFISTGPVRSGSESLSRSAALQSPPQLNAFGVAG